jgi:hypothetical protein
VADLAGAITQTPSRLARTPRNCETVSLQPSRLDDWRFEIGDRPLRFEEIISAALRAARPVVYSVSAEIQDDRPARHGNSFGERAPHQIGREVFEQMP